MVDRLEVLTRHCVGNCSAVAAEGDAAVAEQLAKEAAKPQVGGGQRWRQRRCSRMAGKAGASSDGVASLRCCCR